MEYLDQDFQSNTANQLEPTRTMRQDWHTTARWANFFAIVWFVLTGLGLLATLSIGSTLDQLMMLGMDNPGLEFITSQKTLLMVLMLVGLVAQVALALFQFRFAKSMRHALQFTDQQALEDAWLQFRNLFRWSGIITIAFIIFYFVFIFYLFTMLSTIGAGLGG